MTDCFSTCFSVLAIIDMNKNTQGLHLLPKDKRYTRILMSYDFFYYNILTSVFYGIILLSYGIILKRLKVCCTVKWHITWYASLKLYLRSTLTLSTNNIKAKVKCLANLDTHVPQGLAYCEVWRRSIKTFIDFYIWCVLDPIWKNKQTNKQNWLLFIKIKTQCNMSCILVHLCDHLSSLNDHYVTM